MPQHVFFYGTLMTPFNRPGRQRVTPMLKFSGRGWIRAALFDLWPQRKVKEGIVAFLTARGLEDEKQAAVVSAVLGDVVRVQGRADFENALEALVRLKLAYPEVPSTVTVLPGGVT